MGGYGGGLVRCYWYEDDDHDWHAKLNGKDVALVRRRTKAVTHDGYAYDYVPYSGPKGGKVLGSDCATLEEAQRQVERYLSFPMNAASSEEEWLHEIAVAAAVASVQALHKQVVSDAGKEVTRLTAENYRLNNEMDRMADEMDALIGIERDRAVAGYLQKIGLTRAQVERFAAAANPKPREVRAFVRIKEDD